LKSAVATFRTDDTVSQPAASHGDGELRRPNLALLKRPAARPAAARPTAARPVARKTDPAPRPAAERQVANAKPIAATADSDWETF